MSDKKHWVILVANYGAFVFKGTEDEAEEMRKHKANWERAVAQKRLATPQEIASGNASNCWNHENFYINKPNHGTYKCHCGNEVCKEKQALCS